ncbi:hypothetical protein AVEN_217797-1 [Araneus ventricosus]|uniref:Uncharacterized protein n=1 Tax=Araneus ventricosus TaxID=182803 RepID=A0A4Y2HFB4_ARAVE|nr:hypothetical protein AVEN_217797-1 [Araneus ventricosus]
MGDADGEVVVQIPAQEIEAWMDEALGVVDEGFDNLLALVTHLNERTKGILQELKILENFRKVFIALNVFIVPVVVAIMLCYGTKESVSSDTRGIEVGLQTLVMLLMFLSSSVGLPLYIISVWESYKIYENMNEDRNNQRYCRSFANTYLTSLMFRSTENDSSEQRTLPAMEDSSEIEMESAATETSASVEQSEEKQDHCLDGAEEKPKATEFPILYQFQVLMNEQSPNLAVRLEAAKRGERKETTENGEKVEQNSRQLVKSSLDGAPSTAGNDRVKE